MGGGYDSGLIVLGGDLAVTERWLGCHSAVLLQRIWAAAPLGDNFRSWLPVRAQLERLINCDRDELELVCGEDNAARIIAIGELFAFSRPELPVGLSESFNFREEQHFLWSYVDGSCPPFPIADYDNEENIWIQYLPAVTLGEWLSKLDQDIMQSTRDPRLSSQVDNALELRRCVAAVVPVRCDVMIIHECPP